MAVFIAVGWVACGGQIDPYSTPFDPDASTILLPKDVCGKVLGIPGGTVHYGNYGLDRDGTFTPGVCSSGSFEYQRVLRIQAFGLMDEPASNTCYARCVEHGSCTPPATSSWQAPENKDLPVRWTTYAQSEAFCAWAGGKLPTAAEYTRAAQADAFFPGVAAATKKGDACKKTSFQAEDCPLYAKMDFRVDNAIYPMGIVPEDIGPFGHHDLYGMSTWTRTALLLPEVTVCQLPDGAPDFVSDEPTYGPNPSRVIGHFATYVRQASTEFGQNHMADPVPQVGVRCAF